MPNDSQKQIDQLRKDLDTLSQAFYQNNFSDSKDENKYVRFNTRMKAPTFATAPAICAIGDLYVNSGTGKAYVCSSANTWSLIGTQS